MAGLPVTSGRAEAGRAASSAPQGSAAAKEGDRVCRNAQHPSYLSPSYPPHHCPGALHPYPLSDSQGEHHLSPQHLGQCRYSSRFTATVTSSIPTSPQVFLPSFASSPPLLLPSPPSPFFLSLFKDRVSLHNLEWTGSQYSSPYPLHEIYLRILLKAQPQAESNVHS